MVGAPRFGLPGHVVAAGWSSRLNTTKFCTGIGAGGVCRQSGKMAGIYKLGPYKFTNKWLAKP